MQRYIKKCGRKCAKECDEGAVYVFASFSFTQASLRRGIGISFVKAVLSSKTELILINDLASSRGLHDTLFTCK